MKGSTEQGRFCLAALLAGSVTMSVLSAPVVMADELPEQEFTLARVAIEEAQEVDAGAVASDEILKAEQKLQEARRYNDEGEEVTAERLLEQSKLHAEYAEVKAMHEIAFNSLEEINAALQDLNRELER